MDYGAHLPIVEFDHQPFSLEKLLEYIPVKVVQYRVYTTNPTGNQQLARACEQVFARCLTDPAAIKTTNVTHQPR